MQFCKQNRILSIYDRMSESLLQPTFIIEFLNLEFDAWPGLNIAK